MTTNITLIWWFTVVDLLAVVLWALVLVVGLVYSFRRFSSQPREAKLVAVACLIELCEVAQLMAGDIAFVFASVLPMFVVEILQASRSVFMSIVHPVAWSLVLFAVFGLRRGRYLVEDDRVTE